jgi:hypothetical protein
MSSVKLVVVLLVLAVQPAEGTLFDFLNKDETKKPEPLPELDLSKESSGTPPPTHGEPIEYGVDVSFPMHYNGVSDNYPWLPHNVDPEHNPTPQKYKDMVIQPLGDRQKFYEDFLQGCVDKFDSKGKRCVTNERERIAMSLRQPQSMQNYTDIGFKKIKAPPQVFKMIKEFWDANKNSKTLEQWGTGNTYSKLHDFHLNNYSKLHLKHACLFFPAHTLQQTTGLRQRTWFL